MTEYEITIWPNNQPPILLGYYKSSHKAEALIRACREHNLRADDENIFIIKNRKDTPYKKFNNTSYSR